MTIDFDLGEVAETDDAFIRLAFSAFDEVVVRNLISHAFSRLGVSDETELSVALVGEEQMDRLHRTWMGLAGSTDVMSFPMDELTPGTPEEPALGVLGDIVLCPPVAARQAQLAGHSTLDEFCLLTVHGILHCLGYDHGTQEEETEMFGVQRQILEEFLGRPAPVETRH